PARAEEPAIDVVSAGEQTHAAGRGHADRAVRALRVVRATDRAEAARKIARWRLTHEAAVRGLGAARTHDIVLERVVAPRQGQDQKRTYEQTHGSTIRTCHAASKNLFSRALAERRPAHPCAREHFRSTWYSLRALGSRPATTLLSVGQRAV